MHSSGRAWNFHTFVNVGNRRNERECKKFYSRLAEMISKKRKTNYNVTITWIRRKIAFSLIKLIGICIRGSRSVFQNDNLEMSLSGEAYK